MRFIKKISDRGNVTIPSDVREALGVADGDIVEFEIVGVLRRTGLAKDDDESLEIFHEAADAELGDALDPSASDKPYRPGKNQPTQPKGGKIQ